MRGAKTVPSVRLLSTLRMRVTIPPLHDLNTNHNFTLLLFHAISFNDRQGNQLDGNELCEQIRMLQRALNLEYVAPVPSVPPTSTFQISFILSTRPIYTFRMTFF